MKKKIFLILILIIIIFVSVIVVLYIKNKNTPKAEQPKVLSFLDFIKSETKTPQKNNDGENTPIIDEDEKEVIPVKNKLIQISPDPVAGFDFIEKPLSNSEPKEEDLYNISEITPIYQFKKDIPYMTKGGPLGEDIRKLQKTLNLCEATVVSKSGAGSKGKETNEFKDGTKKSVIELQKMLSIEQTGTLDEATREKINSPWMCKTPKSEISIPTKVAVIFTKREDGHIYNSFLDLINLEQVSNSTFPTVYESFFYNNGKNVSLGYVSKDDINTETAIGEVKDGGIKINEVIKNIITIDADNGTNMMYYMFNFGGNSNGIAITNQGKRDVFSSYFSDWNAETSSKNIILTTKPSYGVLGYVYSVDPSTKISSKLFGSILGLTTRISNKGNLIIYSRSKNNSFETALYDLTTNNNSGLSFKTLPEKCVVSKSEREIFCAVPQDIPQANYPDDWYKGKISFTDKIIKYNIVTQTTESIFEQGENTPPMDIDQIKISPEEDYIVFRNKKDYTIWRLDLFSN